jgi:hypothetical protein
MFRRRSKVLLGILMVSAGCSKPAPKQPVGAPPSPTSITRKAPGGDAHDAHLAALERQKASSFGWRTDKDNQARFPLPDRKNWTRVRFSLIDHLTAFKYGDEEHAIALAILMKVEGGAELTSALCVEQFERESLEKVAHFGGEVTDITSTMTQWNERPLVVRRASGTATMLFKKYEAALSWTGYPAYGDTCLIYAVAVQWDGHRALAEAVRDNWAQGFPRFRALTTDVPFRH